MAVQRVTLDIGKLSTRAQYIRMGEGDRNATTIEAHVRDGGVPVDLTGMAVTLEIMSGPTRLDVIACAVNVDKVICHIDESRVTVPDATAYVRIDDGPRVYSTDRFHIVTLPGNTEE